MDKKGGRYTLQVGAQRWSGRGEANIEPARATVEAGVNWDGTGFAYVAPELATIDLSMDRGTFLWTEGMLLAEVNVTFVEKDYRRTHIFTQASIVGKPRINSKTGEVTGIKLQSDQYRPTSL